MPSSDLLRMVNDLAQLDPERDSFSFHDKFQKIAKRTGWEKLLGRIIYVLTLGFREKNPQLDQAACKAAECAEQIFKEPVQEQFKKQVETAFENLLRIIKANDGSEEPKIESLISRIKALRPVAAVASKPAPVAPVGSPSVVKPPANPLPTVNLAPPVPATPSLKAQIAPLQPGDPDFSNKFVKVILEAQDKAPDQAAFDPNTLQYLNRVGQQEQFKSVLEKLSQEQHPNRDKALLKLMSTQLSDEKSSLLIDTLLASHRLLLANHFDVLNKGNRRLTWPQVLTLVSSLGDLTKPDIQNKLASYAEFLATPAALGSFADEILFQHISLIQPLFSSGNVDFQVHVTYRLLWRLNEGDQSAYQFLAAFDKTGPETWRKVGEKWPSGKALKFHDVFKKYPQLDPLVAFLNALAAKPKPAALNDATMANFDTYSIDTYVKFLFDTAKKNKIPGPLLNLSPETFPSVNILDKDWKWLLQALTHPEQEPEKRWLVFITKTFIAADQDRPALQLDKQFLATVTPEQIQQLKWADHPNWLSFLFALRSGTLTHHAAMLRSYCQTIPSNEQQKILSCTKALGFSYMHLLHRLIDTSTECQPLFVQTLMIQILNDPSLSDNELQRYDFYLPFLNFSEVKECLAQKRLLLKLTPEVCRRALDSWGLHLNLPRSSDSRSLLKECYPLWKIIQSSEDPEQLAAFFLNLFADSTPPKWLDTFLHKDNPDREILTEVLNAFERTPWKLRAALIRGGADWKLEDMQKLQVHLAQESKVFQILNQHSNALRVITEINTLLQHANQWEAAWKKVNEQSPEMKDFILAQFRYASLEGLACSLPSMEKRLGDYFAAIFDETSLKNILNACKTGYVPLSTYQKFQKLLRDIDKNKSSPAAIAIARKASEDIATHRCFGKSAALLPKQYRNPHLSDISLRLGDSLMPANRALINLDPFFCQLPVHDNTVQVPADQVKKAFIHIRCLYGVINDEEIKIPETKEEVDKIKFSLDTLDNPPAGPGVVTLIVEKQEIRAHRFLLACSWPYFENILRPGAPETTAERLELKDFGYQGFKDCIVCMYTGKPPANAHAEDFKKARNKLLGFVA